MKLKQLKDRLFKPTVITMGITNETQDTMFVPFMDYDNVYPEVVYTDLKRLNRLFGICSFIILKNSEEVHPNPIEPKVVGNYNVIGFCKLDYMKWCNILMNHTRTDYIFKKAGQYFPGRNWVIRITRKQKNGKVVKPKPEIKDIVLFKGRCKYEHSTPHRILANRRFGCKLKFRREDGFKDMEFINYNTSVKDRWKWKNVKKWFKE